MMMADGLIPTRVRTFAVQGQALNCKNLPLHQALAQSASSAAQNTTRSIPLFNT